MTNNITIPLAVVEQALEDIRRAARVLGDLPSTNQEGTRTREAWDFLNESGDALSAALFAAAEPVSVPHPDDIAVDKFATAMKEKMAKQRAKGYGGWEGPDCSMEFLQERLFTHVAKGDPVDVGNFAMMLFNRGERTAYEDQWVFELTGNWPGVATSTSPVPAAPELNLTADEMAELCGGQLGASEPVQPVQHTVPDAAKPETAKQLYDVLMQGENETDPIERLRFFCSLAMDGQDWIDVEQFFGALAAKPAPLEKLTRLTEEMGLYPWQEKPETHGERAEFCWIVEQFYTNGNSVGLYLTSLPEPDHQTPDVHKAWQLTTKESAERQARKAPVLAGAEWRAVEHGFHAGRFSTQEEGDAYMHGWFEGQAAALLSACPARVEPLTAFVRNLAKAYTDEARGLLDETYRFASQSPRGRDNINAILQLLDDIDSALEPSKPVQGIEKDQAS